MVVSWFSGIGFSYTAVFEFHGNTKYFTVSVLVLSLNSSVFILLRGAKWKIIPWHNVLIHCQTTSDWWCLTCFTQQTHWFGTRPLHKQNKNTRNPILHVTIITKSAACWIRHEYKVSVLSPVWKGSRERGLGRDEWWKVLAGWSAGGGLSTGPSSLSLNTGMVHLGCRHPHRPHLSQTRCFPLVRVRDSRRCHHWQSEIYV